MKSTNRLKQELDVITGAIPVGSRVALLDEPVCRNPGDHLIQLGTQQFFHDHRIEVVAHLSAYSYHRRWLRRCIGGDTILVCSGGGNLGDAYPRHQRLRERVVADFPHHRVVILPQSVHFRDRRAEQRAVASFGEHRDCHLFVRDRDSERWAKQMGLDKVGLVPDMCHALDPMPGVNPASRACGETLYLMRRDSERSPAAPGLKIGEPACDWPDKIRASDTFTLAALAGAFLLLRRGPPRRPLLAVLDRERAALVRLGVDLLSTYRHIVSSRLHGALLGLLLGKRVTLLASSTGKAAAYYDAWLSDHPDCEYEPSALGRSTVG